MRAKVDVIVVGLGAMGAASAYHLARRGLEVVGLDRYAPPHRHGSSSGSSRIIREAYFESPAYVPLVQRAYGLWEELEQDYGAPLMRITGGLALGHEDGALFQGALASAQEHGLPHRVMSGSEVNDAFAPWKVPDDWAAVHESRAGVLFPERCVAAHLHLARRHGADLWLGREVTSWTADSEGVSVFWQAAEDAAPDEALSVRSGTSTATQSGSPGAPELSTLRESRAQDTEGELRGRHLVVAAGPWTGRLLPGLADHLDVMRQVQLWFKPAQPHAFKPEAFPIFVAEHAPGRYFYGVPDFGDGVKAAVHYEGASVSPGRVPPPIDADESAVREVAERHLHGLGRCLGRQVCLYTNTPDRDFIIDRHPDYEGVVVLSPCSGHGFKFSPAIGEIAADLIEGRAPPVDIAAFRMGRL